jgi:heme/copper-type cytochrome/quinol oxidase subunit 3
MRERLAQDVSALPTWAFESKSTPWWGTLSFMAIEGMGFALVVGAWLYLAAVNPTWPLGPPPATLWPGTTLAVLLVASLVPNWWLNRAALRQELRAVQIGLVIMSIIGLVAVALRGFEIAHLNFRWDGNAYGSVVWLIIGLHATHIVTDVADTIVLAVLMFTRHARPRRFSDVTDNVFYWVFVVLTWLPLYVLLYWAPRWMVSS